LGNGVYDWGNGLGLGNGVYDWGNGLGLGNEVKGLAIKFSKHLKTYNKGLVSDV